MDEPDVLVPWVTPITARPAPTRRGGLLRWAREHLFSSWLNSLASLGIAFILWRVLAAGFDWAVLGAAFHTDHETCRALDNAGACWSVIAEKFRAIVFGRYPYEEQWRALLAMLVLATLIVASCLPRLWRPRLALAWMLGLVVFVVLMRGGVAGLIPVPTSRWGGLPLTLMLAVFGLAGAFPLGIALALWRRSSLPFVRTGTVLYIECVRGVPLISVLFMASFLLPLMLPQGLSPDVLIRVLVGISLFEAAYLAEIIRGGLQAVPHGQIEAARALGLGPWQMNRLIVLPQALRTVVPALMNSFIGVVKDTSLVTIVSLYELTGALTLALGGDPDWRPFYLEGYLFVSAVYWTLCFAMSRYSRWIENRLNTDQRSSGPVASEAAGT